MALSQPEAVFGAAWNRPPESKGSVSVTAFATQLEVSCSSPGKSQGQGKTWSKRTRTRTRLGEECLEPCSHWSLCWSLLVIPSRPPISHLQIVTVSCTREETQ